MKTAAASLKNTKNFTDVAAVISFIKPALCKEAFRITGLENNRFKNISEKIFNTNF